MADCCTHYHTDKYRPGYVIIPIFRVRMCENCGEIELICSDYLQTIFEIFFAPFWRGNVFIADTPPVEKNGF